MLDRPCMPWRKAYAANNNDANFVARVAKVTEPSGDGIISLGGPGQLIFRTMRVLPYGLGSDNDVFSIRVIGWNRVVVGTTANPLIWVPTTLIEASCTISTSVGVAASPILNTERFADTIAAVANMEPTYAAVTTRFGTVKFFSPANDTPAWFELELPPVEKLDFAFDQTTGTPTMNALLLFSN